MTVANVPPRRYALPLALALVALTPGRARGADAATDNATVADALFRDGVTLFEGGKVHEACAKFSESFRLDPANGTLQNLALCHVREGKRASAWLEFGQLAGRAAQAGQKAREQMARGQVAELERRLARITLTFTPTSDVEEIAIDGEALGHAAWSTPLPLDPGDHTFTFRAPGKKKVAAVRSVTVPDTAATIRVDVPELVPEPKGAPDAIAVTNRAPAESGGAASNPRRTIALVAGGAGVVLIGVGTYFGLRTFSQKSDANAHCDGAFCDAQGLSLEHDAHTSATWSTIGFATGLALLGTGAVLWLTAPRASAAQVALVPAISPREAGGSLRVSF